jgi:hypothetical protein
MDAPHPPSPPAPVSPLVTHRGGCHCGAVRFELDAPPHLTAWDCNCSICAMKRNTHVVVPAARFRLLTPRGAMTEYRFNTGVARHLFCATCGVQAYYHPRSNPDGVAVTVACLDAGTAASVTTRQFDGRNWEAFIGGSGIAAHSKVEGAPEGGAALGAPPAATAAPAPDAGAAPR